MTACLNGCGPLSTLLYEDVEIEICPHCAGVWLDSGELGHIVRTRDRHWPRKAAQTVLANLRNKGISSTEKQRSMSCPRCHDPLYPVNYQGHSGIIVNTCPTEHGVWLDKGELAKIQIYMEFWEDVADRDKEKFDRLLEDIRQRFHNRQPEREEEHKNPERRETNASFISSAEPSNPSAGPTAKSLSAIQWYYLATPLFLMADMMFGARFRVAESLDGPFRHYYYGMCIGLALVCLAWPVLQNGIALLEGALNVLLLALSVLLIDYDAAFAGQHRLPLEATWQSVLTFLITGLTWVYVFRRASLSLSRK